MCFHGKSYDRLVATSLDPDIVYCFGGVVIFLKTGLAQYHRTDVPLCYSMPLILLSTQLFIEMGGFSDLHMLTRLVSIASCMCSWPTWTISNFSYIALM